MCRVIPVYRSATLDAQLDIMTSLYLNEVVQVDVSRRIITLPKICAWFLNDFAPMKKYSSVETHLTTVSSEPPSATPSSATSSSSGGHANVSATTMHCLIAVVPYLQDELKRNCIKLLTEHLAVHAGQSAIGNLNQGGLTIKFLPYSFKCRRLEQYQYS